MIASSAVNRLKSTVRLVSKRSVTMEAKEISQQLSLGAQKLSRIILFISTSIAANLYKTERTPVCYLS